MTSKSILGWTEFPDESRDMFLNRIYDRMDTIFENWLYGEYDDCDLRCAIEVDGDVNHLCYLYDLLHDAFRFDVNERYNMIGVKQWLWCRHGLSQYPTRAMRTYYVESVDSRARTFSMHGPDGEVQRIPCEVARPMDFCPIPVALPVESVEHVPRRSTRAKKQREFYYGF
jgi:hypothetical protein